MKSKLTLLFLTSLLCSCAVFKPAPKVVSTNIENDGTQIIELESPIQKELDKQIAQSSGMSAHTVYDNEKKIEALNVNKKNKFLQTLAGPYKFHTVKNKESLGIIATKIYGDKRMWKYLQGWNQEVLDNGIAVGMKIKYLPKEHKYFAKFKFNNDQPTRMPASTK